MKKELPIAVCLLALGIALIVGTSEGVDGGSSIAVADEVTLPASHEQNFAAAPVSDSPTMAASAFLEINRGAGGQHDQWCKSTIKSIARSLNRIPAMAVRTQLISRVDETDLMATGKYFQTLAGKKTRLEILFSDSQPAFSLLQISDSQFSYRLQSTPSAQRLEFIDLNRLQNQNDKLSGFSGPAGWVMGEGMGGSLVHYAEAFHFQSVEADNSGSIVLRGIWDKSVLENLVHSHLPVEQRPKEINWQELPFQIPHAIELTFANRTGDLMQPEIISFFRFADQEGRRVAAPMLTIRFDTLTISPSLPSELFEIETGGLEAAEMTGIYNQKFAELYTAQRNASEQANRSNETLESAPISSGVF